MPHISATAASHPDKPAIIMANTGEVVTYRQLDERSNQGAHLLRSLGLQRGDHIGMMVENTRQFLEIVHAAMRSGIIFTPVSTHLKKAETRYILENCNARLLIGSLKLAAVAEELLGELSGIAHYYMVNGTRPGFESWDEAIASQPVTPIADQSMGTPMLYSSGTTGQPKGVLTVNDITDINEVHPNLAAFAAV